MTTYRITQQTSRTGRHRLSIRSREVSATVTARDLPNALDKAKRFAMFAENEQKIEDPFRIEGCHIIQIVGPLWVTWMHRTRTPEPGDRRKFWLHRHGSRISLLIGLMRDCYTVDIQWIGSGR